MAGRPTKYTPEVVRIIRESLAQGDSRQLACKKAGISDDSFGRWLTDNAEFAAVVKNAEDEFRNWEFTQLLASAKKGLRVLIEGQETEETTISRNRKEAFGEEYMKYCWDREEAVEV